MKVSQLLDELNISLNTLKRFEKELNCEFLFLDQVVNDKVVEKVKEILKNSKQETEYQNLKGPKIIFVDFGFIQFFFDNELSGIDIVFFHLW